jgi:hypothetical protein
MSTEQVSKIYRASEYDVHDTTYANKMKTLFSELNDDLQIKFSLFTDNLMGEDQINRSALLKAIDDFEKSEKNIAEKNISEKNISDNNMDQWMRFTDMAFNYRPYQTCSVM